jgi:lactoylglutathione lyase
MKYILLLATLFINSLVTYGENAIGGVDHVGLSVSDLSASENFFVKYAGFKLLGKKESYPAVFVANDDVMITLWQVNDPSTAQKFDRKNTIGLHHLALSVNSFKALNELHEKLVKDPQVKIEFSPELMGNGPTKHMMVFEPSGNRIEFVHRPKTSK